MSYIDHKFYRVNVWSVLFSVLLPMLAPLFYWLFMFSNNLSPFSLFVFIVIVFAIFLLIRIATNYPAWRKTDSFIYLIAKQPIVSVNSCTVGNNAQVVGVIEAKENYSIKVNNIFCVFHHYLDYAGIINVINTARTIPFYVRDDTGRIRVEIKTQKHERLDRKGNVIGIDELPNYTNSDIDAFRYSSSNEEDERSNNYFLPEGITVLVNGFVYEKDGEKVISAHEHYPFVITTKNKGEYLQDYYYGEDFFLTSNYLILISVIALCFAGAIFLSTFSYLILLIAPILVLIVLGRMVYSAYNRMVELQTRCTNSKMQIDIESKKRIELIPELEKMAKVHAKYEKGINLVIAQTRALKLDNKNNKDALLALVEKYPQIKSDASFKHLFSSLVQIEDNIAYFRAFYNKTATKFNTLISLAPINLLAKSTGFKEKELL